MGVLDGGTRGAKKTRGTGGEKMLERIYEKEGINGRRHVGRRRRGDAQAAFAARESNREGRHLKRGAGDRGFSSGAEE